MLPCGQVWLCDMCHRLVAAHAHCWHAAQSHGMLPYVQLAVFAPCSCVFVKCIVNACPLGEGAAAPAGRQSVHACAALCSERIPIRRIRGLMGKRKPVSILTRAAQQELRPAKPKKQKTQGGGADQASHPQSESQRSKQHGSGGGSGGSGRRHEAAGLRPTSPVHQQASYAIRRLLEADARKRGGVSLKSLTLAPHITAKKADRKSVV